MSPGFPPMAERCGLVPYLGFVLAVRLSPTPVDQGESGTITHLLETLHKRGLPEWFGYSWLEFSANVAMFVPLGFLVALALSRRTLWLSFLLIPACPERSSGLRASSWWPVSLPPATSQRTRWEATSASSPPWDSAR